MLRALADHPNIEVRLFNPFCCLRGSTLGRFAGSLGDIYRVNHRMHNKLLIADGLFAVAGGRNIADEYFMLNMSSNFVDMDAFVIGAVVRPAAADLRPILEQRRGLPGAGDRAADGAARRRRWPSSSD